MTKLTNIQKFSLHDGPGIRTCVFFKGCSLHCPWCANPETRSNHIELLHNQSKCSLCKHCENICTTQAIKFINDQFTFNSNLCCECYQCEDECLNNAITFYGKEVDNHEIINEVLKDLDYYRNSNGGVTFSGGEPMMQFENLQSLLKMSKENHLNTAIETTGNYSLDLLLQIYNDVDYFLYDYKHLDKNALNEVTGGNYDLINDNLKYLLNKNPDKVYVRMPIIYGFNDKRDLIYQTIDYLNKIGCKHLNLLPYHSLGKPKYEQMSLKYDYPTKMMNDQELLEYNQYAQGLGIDSKIGG